MRQRNMRAVALCLSAVQYLHCCTSMQMGKAVAVNWYSRSKYLWNSVSLGQHHWHKLLAILLFMYTKAPLFIICCARIQHKPSAFILQKKVVEHFRAKGSYPGHRLFALNRNIWCCILWPQTACRVNESAVLVLGLIRLFKFIPAWSTSTSWS